MYSSTTGLQ